jgi:TatA/E family protein of Tat protein translocase
VPPPHDRRRRTNLDFAGATDIMPTPGPLELVIILVIALLILGPGKLPDVGAALGKSIREFRKASSDVQEAVNVNVDTSPLPPAPAPDAAAPAPAAPTATVPAAAAVPAEPAPAAPAAPAGTPPASSSADSPTAAG